MRCENTENGCQWMGELGELLKKHMQKCEYYFVPCTYECQERGTMKEILFKDLSKHIKKRVPEASVHVSEMHREGGIRENDYRPCQAMSQRQIGLS